MIYSPARERRPGSIPPGTAGMLLQSSYAAPTNNKILATKSISTNYPNSGCENASPRLISSLDFLGVLSLPQQTILVYIYNQGLLSLLSIYFRLFHRDRGGL